MPRLSDRGEPNPRRPRSPWWWPLLALGLVAVVVLGVGGSEGGLTAKITNTSDKVQTGSLVTAAASAGASECDLSAAAYSPITATNAASCSGTLAPSGTLASSATAATSTTLSEKGSLGSAAGLSEGSCGPVQLANSATASDPMLIRGTTTSFAQAGPTSLSGSLGLGLSGTSGYAADIAGAPGPSTTSFTEVIWFKTTTGGTLIGFTKTPSDYQPHDWDKMVWVDNAGHVVFAVASTLSVELTSSGTYNDGNWHLAVASLNTSSGMSLSIDGGTPVTNTTTSAQSYNGYWHVGWDNETTGWLDPPTDAYFTGTLADAAILPSALTSTQITALHAASSQAAFASQVSSDGATDFWPLGDDGTSVYTGTVPDVTPAACSFADATVGVAGAATTCAAPSSSSACAAPASSTTLATLASKTTPFATGPTPAQPLSVTVTVARDATNTVAAYPYATGLHLTAPLGLAATAGSFTATLTWPAENIIL